MSEDKTQGPDLRLHARNIQIDKPTDEYVRRKLARSASAEEVFGMTSVESEEAVSEEAPTGNVIRTKRFSMTSMHVEDAI
jgi:hypothetical protein